MLHLVMDGAGDMPPEWAEEYDIHVVPSPIFFNGKIYHPGVDLSNDEFYRLVDEGGVIPTTSQPSPFEFIKAFRQFARTGDSILSIHVTSKLSGTLESANAAAKELEGEINVIPIDSYAGSAALGMMCREARLMDRAGITLDGILQRMEEIRQNVNIVLTLDNLNYARMSGRVKALQASLVSLLNVKPIVVLRDGIIEMADKVRTRSRALQHILDMMHQKVGDTLIHAAVVHARDLESGQYLMALVKERFNCEDLILTDLSIAVAANLGPGTVGIIAYPAKQGV